MKLFLSAVILTISSLAIAGDEGQLLYSMKQVCDGDEPIKCRVIEEAIGKAVSEDSQNMLLLTRIDELETTYKLSLISLSDGKILSSKNLQEDCEYELKSEAGLALLKVIGCAETKDKSALISYSFQNLQPHLIKTYQEEWFRDPMVFGDNSDEEVILYDANEEEGYGGFESTVVNRKTLEVVSTAKFNGEYYEHLKVFKSNVHFIQYPGDSETETNIIYTVVDGRTGKIIINKKFSTLETSDLVSIGPDVALRRFGKSDGLYQSFITLSTGIETKPILIKNSGSWKDLGIEIEKTVVPKNADNQELVTFKEWEWNESSTKNLHTVYDPSSGEEIYSFTSKGERLSFIDIKNDRVCLYGSEEDTYDPLVCKRLSTNQEIFTSSSFMKSLMNIGVFVSGIFLEKSHTYGFHDSQGVLTKEISTQDECKSWYAGPSNVLFSETHRKMISVVSAQDAQGDHCSNMELRAWSF